MSAKAEEVEPSTGEPKEGVCDQHLGTLPSSHVPLNTPLT